jgi:O-antigen/teichoic acid export membrane protein
MDRVLMPGVGDLIGRQEFDKLKKIFLSSTKVLLALGLTLAVFLLLFNRHIVRFWVGEDNFAGQGVTMVFALAVFQMIVSHHCSSFLSSFLKLKSLALVRWTEGVVNLSLSIYLAQEIGMIGVALGTLVAGALTSAWYFPLKTCRLLSVTLADLSREVVFPLFRFSLLLFGLALLFAEADKSSLFMLLLDLATFALSTIVGGYFLLLSPKEKKIFRRPGIIFPEG